MQILVDTNVLVRLTEAAHLHHPTAKSAVLSLRQSGHHLCIVPQVLYEFWSVATRPIEINGLGMAIEEARNSVEQMKRSFRLLRDERAIFERWEQLVFGHQVNGKQTHDTRLVAAILRHNITHLLTFNFQDFTRYPEVMPVEPQNAASISRTS
jgi:predicted nucleic acid-binding protein